MFMKKSKYTLIERLLVIFVSAVITILTYPWRNKS